MKKVIIKIVSSKSQTMRALLFSSLGIGTSEIYGILNSYDTESMIASLNQIGIEIVKYADHVRVKGVYDKALSVDDLKIDAGNSGQVLRFLGATLALFNGKYLLTGDCSIQNNRPVSPMIKALRELGAKVRYLGKTGYAPVEIEGPIKAGNFRMDGKDSQPVSAMLIACSFLAGNSTIYVDNPGEKPWIELTLSWINKLGGSVVNENYQKYTVQGGMKYQGFKYRVPGDFSSAAFPLVSAIITNCHCILDNLDFEDIQGDKKLIDILAQMGANLNKDRKNNRLTVNPDRKLQGGVFDVNDIIDAVPILAVVGCFCENPLELRNCQIARFKESNRLEAITKELRKMGADIDCFEDRLIIKPSKLISAQVSSHNDHRIAMSLCVASLNSKGNSFGLDNAECINKSYPNFFDDLKKFKKD